MSIAYKLYRVVSPILTVVLLAFAYLYISNLVSQIDIDSLSLNWGWVILSALLFIIFYGIVSLNWLVSTRIFNKKSSDKQLLVFFASQPYKYLPTSLFIFSSRTVYAKKLGLGLKESSLAQLLENMSLFASNFALFGLFYLGSMHFGIMAAVATALVLAITVLYKKYPKVNLRLKSNSISIESKKLLQMFMIATLGWFVCGLSFLSLNYVLGINVDVLTLLAANTIAFSLSMLAVFAPGGIGVREAVYGFFAVSAAAIIYWRILVFIVDMVVGFISIAIINSISSRKRKTT